MSELAKGRTRAAREWKRLMEEDNKQIEEQES
jgi:hypothetical protein